MVYAKNQLVNRRDLWMNIKGLANTIQDPWMVIGDYNNVLTVADRMGGCLVQKVKYIDLKDMMNEVGLF